MYGNYELCPVRSGIRAHMINLKCHFDCNLHLEPRTIYSTASHCIVSTMSYRTVLDMSLILFSCLALQNADHMNLELHPVWFLCLGLAKTDRDQDSDGCRVSSTSDCLQTRKLMSLHGLSKQQTPRMA